jgi:hypothetical protein
VDILFDSTFGSRAGGWTYPYVQPLTAMTFFVSLAIIPLLLVLGYISRRRIDRHETALVCVWLVAGFGGQLGLRSLYPYSNSAIIESPTATSFYTVTQQHSASELITHYHSLADSIPIHARANLPGKFLLFYLLETLTASTETMGYLIILISNLGGLLIYLLARQLFQNRLPALYAMILYLFLPMKLYFFPILNTVTPVPMLLSLLLFAYYLKSKQDGWLVALGVSLYALLLFEPLPLVTGLIFLALIVKDRYDNKLTWLHVVKVFTIVPGSFFLLHLLIALTLHFNIIDAFYFALRDTRAFNITANRPYGVWLIHNLKDFFFNAGIAPSLLFLICLAYTLRQLIGYCRKREQAGLSAAAFLTRSDVLLVVAFTCVLLILDLIGVNRGETIRLWIFLAVIMYLIAAHYCATARSYYAFASVFGFTVFQTALCISRVGFVIP